jgi:hypothetical protein
VLASSKYDLKKTLFITVKLYKHILTLCWEDQNVKIYRRQQMTTVANKSHDHLGEVGLKCGQVS